MNITWICLPRRSVRAGPVPLYGIWVMRMPAPLAGRPRRLQNRFVMVVGQHQDDFADVVEQRRDEQRVARRQRELLEDSPGGLLRGERVHPQTTGFSREKLRAVEEVEDGDAVDNSRQLLSRQRPDGLWHARARWRGSG